MKILGNSSRGLISLQKRWLYRWCTLSIALHGFQLWYYNKASLHCSLNILRKIQQRAAIWITGAFCILPTAGIKAISGLIPIYLHLKKLYDRFLLRSFSLLLNYIIKSIINTDRSYNQAKHCLSINSLTLKQVLCLRSPLIDIDNRCNKFLPFFALLDKEFSPGNCLCDNFPDYFSFYPWLHNVNDQLCKLNNITIQASLDSSAYIVISDASIKNQVATLVSHVYSFDRPIVKTFHQAVNISTTETELFTIRCGINQTIGIPHIKCIIIITDSLYVTKKIFDSSLHPYQLHSATISHELREFFNKDIHNHIKF